MTPNQYQQACKATAIFPDGVAMAYLPLKLVGEAGEVAEKIGKAYRKGSFKALEPEWHNGNELAKELGDVLWYVAVLADKLGYSLSDIMEMNINKLADRKERGVLEGNGDNR